MSGFVRDNRTNLLTTNIDRLADVTRVLVTQRDALGRDPRRRAGRAVQPRSSPTTPGPAPWTPATTRQAPDFGQVLCASSPAIGKADQCAELTASLNALEKGQKPALPGGSAASPRRT